MLILNILIYLVSFVLIWFGSGLIVTSAAKFSRKLKLSPFAFSFVFLGILTSVPEFSVGLQSVADKNPQIFVGNLLGGILVIFLFVIPLLAIFGKGVSLKHELDNWTLLTTLAVILSPSAFILDKRVTNFEGIVLVIFYIVLLFLVERKNGIFDQENSQLLNIKAYSYRDIFKILLGIGVVFFASSLIVEKTIFFANLLNTSAFYISLIIVAIGTNLPELSLAVRSVILGNKEIAMGDYIGSAIVNSLLFGVFTLLNNGEVLTISNFFVTFIFTMMALCLFYFFFKTKKYISQAEGVFLLLIYITFVFLELTV
jgi:cation:H+ antiporter